MIILEGADGTGKTTLANRLKDSLDFPIIKAFQNTNEDLLKELKIPTNSYHEDFYFLEYWDQLGRPDCVLDRSIISGFIYERQYKFKAAIALNYWLSRLLPYKDDIYIVFLEAEVETIIERDKEWEGLEHQLHDIINSNRAILDRLNGLLYKTIVLNSSKLSPEVMERKVKRWIL